MPALDNKNQKNSSANQHLSFVNLTRMLLICGVVLAFSFGCRSEEKSTSQTQGSSNSKNSNTIVTTSYPLEWVTQEIVGYEYTVNFPAGDSDQPNRWRPDRETIAEIQAADLIICNGVAAPYATWMKTVSLPSSKVIESASQGLSLPEFIAVQDIQIVHSHGPEGEHSHPTMVTRTWLDPAMLVKQANYITQQLCKQRPNDADQFKENLAKLTAKLESIAPQSLPEPTATVFAATPELKFLTRATSVNDLHFNWNKNTTLAEAEADLASKTSAEATKFILFPQRQAPLAERLKPLLKQQQLAPIFIDTLDQAIANQSLVRRLDENIAKLQKITSTNGSSNN